MARVEVKDDIPETEIRFDFELWEKCWFMYKNRVKNWIIRRRNLEYEESWEEYSPLDGKLLVVTKEIMYDITGYDIWKTQENIYKTRGDLLNNL